MEAIEIRNDFHNTKTWVIACRPLTKAKIARIRRKLCGCSGCKCGDELGARGPQSLGYIALLDEAIEISMRG